MRSKSPREPAEGERCFAQGHALVVGVLGDLRRLVVPDEAAR
jgi:hypothetical protein